MAGRVDLEEFVQKAMDEMTGLIANSALDAQVAGVRDLFERIDVDGSRGARGGRSEDRQRRGRYRSDSATEWLRR